jgi:PIN domain nuclease of toxin-antitoxin system
VNALLDTHIWIWLLEDPSKLALPVLRQIEIADTLTLSAASIWEIAIKTELGKLSMKASPEAVRDEILHAMYAHELPIQSTHALDAARLPKLHKDPFDRILIAQARVEHMVLVTADEAIRQYGGAMLWAG